MLQDWIYDQFVFPLRHPLVLQALSSSLAALLTTHLCIPRWSMQHAQHCLNVAWDLSEKHMPDPDTRSNCLRFSFHDAGSYSTVTDQGG